MANNTYDVVMSGKSDSNIRFTDFRNMILSYGFRERIRGDHYKEDFHVKIFDDYVMV